MKLSKHFIEKFLDLDKLPLEEIAEKLTMGAFEVEEVQKVGSKLKGPILVGKILGIEKHPNADRLQVARVTIDGKTKLVIVCGAKNIKVGQLVPVSLEGSVVINKQDGSELVIKNTKIRGIESFGMLLSPSELGIKTEDADGILILKEDAKLGQNVIDYLSLNQGEVLEAASRSNRGDALSVFGLCKEISALSKRKLKEITFKEPKIDKSVQTVKPKIENIKDTYVFYLVTIEDILVKESPDWLKSILNSAGIRSINNIVDITNYINICFGQPLHAYDTEKLNGSCLTSRNAKNSEKITTIDGKTQELKEGILVIADEKNPVSVAGIMGGISSEVTNSTKNIVLEGACFNHAKVRRGSRTIGLSTDSSKRFERGIDSNFTYKAILKAIELIEECCSASSKKPRISQIEQAGEPIKTEIKIQLSSQEVKRVLGINLKAKEISNLLELLDFKTKVLDEKNLEAAVPSSRANDVTRQIDLIEELARLYGYDRIPIEPPKSTISVKKYTHDLEIVKSYFLGFGFSEACLSSLIGEQILNNKDFPFNFESAITMMNPLSKEHSTLRQSLIPGLLETVKLNQNYKTNLIKLFEIGKIYFSNKIKSKNDKETSVTESLMLGGVISGIEEGWQISKFNSQNVLNNPNELLFFTSKGIIEGFFKKIGTKITFKQQEEKFLNPLFALKILLNNSGVGYLGCLHPQTEKKLEIRGPQVVFEICLDPILAELNTIKAFHKISLQPLVERDVTVDLLKSYPSSNVYNEIKSVSSNFVVDIKLISVYELDKENKSLTFRLKMQDLEQTLTSKQIDDEVNKIKNHLTSFFKAKFRV